MVQRIAVLFVSTILGTLIIFLERKYLNTRYLSWLDVYLVIIFVTLGLDFIVQSKLGDIQWVPVFTNKKDSVVFGFGSMFFAILLNLPDIFQIYGYPYRVISAIFAYCLTTIVFAMSGSESLRSKFVPWIK